LLEYFSWELFDHHPYSPDHAPSDYLLFTSSRPQHLNTNEELIDGRHENAAELNSSGFLWLKH
jgi:hypothetical protein